MAVLLYDPEFRAQDPASSGDLVYDVLEFDAVVQVIHSGQSQVTRHPVESGEDLSDHSVPQPREIQLNDAVVTDFPLLLPGEDYANQLKAGKSPSAGDLSELGKDLVAVDPLAARAYQQLEHWRRTGRALSLADDFESYEHVLIQSVTVPRTAATGNAMIAQIKLVTIDIAESRLVDVPVTERAATTSNQGPKAKTVATDAEIEAGNESVAYVVTDIFI